MAKGSRTIVREPLNMCLILPLSGNAFKAAYFIGFEIIVPQPVVCEFHTVQRRALQLFPVNTQINVVFSAFTTILNLNSSSSFTAISPRSAINADAPVLSVKISFARLLLFKFPNPAFCSVRRMFSFSDESE